MHSRRLSDLDPDLEIMAHQFLDECAQQNIDVIVTCTYRDDQEQAILYAQGRTAPGGIVTNAKPGESAHNCVSPSGTPDAKAFDVVPIVNGKPDWTAQHPVWKELGQIGRDCGLEWAGDWPAQFGFDKDYSHFQLPGFKP